MSSLDIVEFKVGTLVTEVVVVIVVDVVEVVGVVIGVVVNFVTVLEDRVVLLVVVVSLRLTTI